MGGVVRRHVGRLLFGACLLALTHPLIQRPAAQEQVPNRPEFTLTAKSFRYSPDRIEVTQDDLVKVTIHSEDIAYSFAIDEYRIVKRSPAGGTTTFEFRAARAGTFPYYCNLSTDPGCKAMRGTLVVRAK